ncbi:MAG: hypothetical protein LLF96_03080 [Eubacteriales bacterium]|nr:hypothetical protein [Eubacteriales bacterium]
MNAFELAGYDKDTAEQLQRFADEKMQGDTETLLKLYGQFRTTFTVGIGGNIQAGLCPPWPYHVERRCMRMKDGHCLYLVNPHVKVCETCWKRALQRPELLERLAAGQHGEKDKRF